MIRRTFWQSSRLKLQGIAFLLFIALAAAYLVAVFSKTFEDARHVSLVVPTAGNQLNSNADVKIRGKLVGRVANQTTNGNELTIDLALVPGDFAMIPGNVTAAILPKTLFGEKYVDLLIPGSGGQGSLAVGAVVPQDTSTTTVELEKVLADLFPVLRAVKPQDLNQSLDAISTALTGNGDDLGANLVNGGEYLAQLEPQLPKALDDLAALNQFTDTLSGGASCADAPSSAQAQDPTTVVGCLVGFLRNNTTTSRTVLDQNDVLTQFLRGTGTFTDDLKGFLVTNQDRIIQVAATSRPGLELLARDNPLVKPAVDTLLTLLEKLAGKGGPFDQGGSFFSIQFRIASDPGPYTTADCPVYNPSGASSVPPAYGPNCPATVTATSSGTSAKAVKPAVVGSPAEKQTIAAIVSAASGVPLAQVPDVASLIVGGSLRGSHVTLGN